MSNKILPKLIVILGPNASGKSDLAARIAKKFNNEIISADSRQVYKGLNIGSGKITKKEMQGIQHYLLDIASPKRRFTVAQYKKEAEKAIKTIYKKNKTPILCGGSGFYIQAVIDDLILPRVKPNYELREKLEKLSEPKLYQILKNKDPLRAKAIDQNNKRRLIRALEIIQQFGKVPKFRKRKKYNLLILGISLPREKLKKRIHKRLVKRLKQGMIKEVENLIKIGVSYKRLEDLGLEYRYLAYYLQGKMKKAEMTQKLYQEICQYAKRQMTWFKKDKRVNWIKNYQEAEKLVQNFLKEKAPVN